VSACVCVCFKFKVHCGSALGPGASELPYYFTLPVTFPDVNGGLTVWWYNHKIKNYLPMASAERNNVVYWKTNRKIKNDLQWPPHPAVLSTSRASCVASQQQKKQKSITAHHLPVFLM